MNLQMILTQAPLIIANTDAGNPYTAGIGRMMHEWAPQVRPVDAALADRLEQFKLEGTC